jgi:hypothetical protein
MEVSIMVAVTEFSWEEVSSPDFGTRAAWRAAVAEIADKARAKLPECNGRVDSAVKMVLAGDVELLADGTAKVASQSNGTTAYHVVNRHCDCRDYEKAPHNFCKHRLSAAISRRAQDLTKAQASNGQAEAPPAPDPAPAQVDARVQADVPTAPLPEAPASVNVRLEVAGRQVQLTLRDSDESRLLQRLEAVLQRFPVADKPVDTTPQCPTQGAMKPSTKGKGWYCPVKMADGSWCKSR